ncbi:MAG: hypothetical protein AAGH76_14365 [Pseudomonadota bacterium]
MFAGFARLGENARLLSSGVTALYAKGGIDHRERGTDYGNAWEADDVVRRYHRADDEHDANWDLCGVAEGIELYLQLGAALAAGRHWPDRYPGNEFKAARDASAASRR